jgi:predicted 2-oxoglutarate/Fe(II)-dependent dioxygenase YbiX
LSIVAQKSEAKYGKKKEIVTDKIFTISQVLTAGQCSEFIQNSEFQGYDEAPITTLGAFVMRKDVRNNTRVMVDDPVTADYIWEKIAPYISASIAGWQAIGLNERIRFYRYDAGQYFTWHYDGCFLRNDEEKSLLTLMIYLNDDFRGVRRNLSSIL